MMLFIVQKKQISKVNKSTGAMEEFIAIDTASSVDWRGIYFDNNGGIYSVGAGGQGIWKYSEGTNTLWVGRSASSSTQYVDGTALDARFSQIVDIVFDHNNIAYLTDGWNNSYIRKIGIKSKKNIRI